MDKPASPTRREFAAALTLLAAPLTAAADDKDQKEKPAAKPPDAADVLAEIVLKRFPKHALNDEQLAAVRRGVRNGLASGNRLGQVKLTNADEPAFVFRADLP